MMRALSALLVAVLLAAAAAPRAALAAGSTTYGSAVVNYKILPSVHAQVVPNYAAGFGPQGGAGSGSSPAPGAGAVLDGGTVDFGNVVVGYQYIYKYAAQVSVQTNDAAGFVVYAEGATDLNGSNPVPSPSTFPIFQTLYWLASNGSNTPFTPAKSFVKTMGTPIAGGAMGIDYSGVGGKPSAGSVVWSYPVSGNVSQGFDYQLRLPGTIPTSQFNVYVVYTVIGN
ncbi:MAG: hypothetical protein JO036_02680 [Candidatus Eremiobacteraeota bacterium]|nr:hypothetical protein [Candidatus Eremiobacteraeota bacterium]